MSYYRPFELPQKNLSSNDRIQYLKAKTLYTECVSVSKNNGTSYQHKNSRIDGSGRNLGTYQGPIIIENNCLKAASSYESLLSVSKGKYLSAPPPINLIRSTGALWYSQFSFADYRDIDIPIVIPWQGSDENNKVIYNCNSTECQIIKFDIANEIEEYANDPDMNLQSSEIDLNNVSPQIDPEYFYFFGGGPGVIGPTGSCYIKNENSYLDYVRFYGVTNIARNYQRYNLLYGFSYPHKFEFNCLNANQRPWNYSVGIDRLPEDAEIDDDIDIIESINKLIKPSAEEDYGCVPENLSDYGIVSQSTNSKTSCESNIKTRNVSFKTNDLDTYNIENLMLNVDKNNLNSYKSCCLIKEKHAFVGLPYFNSISEKQSFNNSGIIIYFYYDGKQWIEKQRISPICNFENAFFGTALSFENNILVASAIGNDTLDGAIYVYNFKNNRFIENQIILSPSYCKNFGKSIELCKNDLMIGAEGKKSSKGIVFFYHSYNNEEWEEYAFKYEDEISFGDSTIFSYPYSFIASSNEENKGCVRIFDRSTGIWKLSKVLQNYEDVNGFGKSICYNNNKLLIGAPYNNNNNGCIYVFNNHWDLENIINPNKFLKNAYLGYNISFHNNNLITLVNDSNFIYLFEYKSQKWKEKKIYLKNKNDKTNFDNDIAIDNNTILISLSNRKMSILYI